MLLSFLQLFDRTRFLLLPLLCSSFLSLCHSIAVIDFSVKEGTFLSFFSIGRPAVVCSICRSLARLLFEYLAFSDKMKFDSLALPMKSGQRGGTATATTTTTTTDRIIVLRSA